MNNKKKLSILLEAFFTERLMNQVQASPHTIASYRDTFQLLLKYAVIKLKKQPYQLILEDLNANFLSGFFIYLEKKRNISTQSRNVRLSAIRSFFKYLSFQEPGRSALISQVLAIPNKKTTRKLIHSLTQSEMEALIATPDLSTWIGRRDYALILVAMETGLRLSELIHLTWEQVHWTEKGGYIQCVGKGRKERCSVFSHATSKALQFWRREKLSSDFVFPTIYKGTAMSSDCVQKLLKKYGKLAEENCPSLKNKKVTPHVLRYPNINKIQTFFKLAC
jgi:integrase/recombinase XerD